MGTDAKRTQENGEHRMIKHFPECPQYKARNAAIGIACDHGYDVCPVCDPCTCQKPEDDHELTDVEKATVFLRTTVGIMRDHLAVPGAKLTMNNEFIEELANSIELVNNALSDAMTTNCKVYDGQHMHTFTAEQLAEYKDKLEKLPVCYAGKKFTYEKDYVAVAGDNPLTEAETHELQQTYGMQFFEHFQHHKFVNAADHYPGVMVRIAGKWRTYWF
jgi:hypothetical protein